MKKSILKNYNKILSLLLTVLGIGGACTFMGCEYGTPNAEYGTPYATFKVHGKVSSEANTEIPYLRVIMQNDTAYTNENGDYNVQAGAWPDDQDFEIRFMDVDGNANGLYQAKDTIVSFENPQFEDGDGSWNSGETSKELNIRLKEDN